MRPDGRDNIDGKPLRDWGWLDYALFLIGFSAIIGAVVWLGHTWFSSALAR